jgi:hypothetical protein
MALTSERPYRPHRQSPDSAIILMRIGQFEIILCKERFPIKKISETTVPPNGEFPPVAVYEYVAVVISQDGGVRFVCQKGGRVTYWEQE